MDIDFYHMCGWVCAIVLTGYGLVGGGNRRLIPLYAVAGLVLAVGAGQQGGLAVVESKWHEGRYMLGFVITSIGLVLWALAFQAGRAEAKAS